MLQKFPIALVQRRCHGVIAGVLGVPLNKGQPRGGVERGPQTLRSHDLIRELSKYCASVTDIGDFEEAEYEESAGRIKNPISVGQNNLRLSRQVAENLETFKPLINIGGDHSMAIGTISGTARYLGTAPAVIWVDAHADINPPELSPSGNLHGTPMSFLLKELEGIMKPLDGFEWVKRMISSNDIAYIGLRDVDDVELEILRKYNIQAYDMKDIDDHGIQNILQKCLEKIDPTNDRPIHLSFDIDAMDPALAPATGTPVRGGLYRVEGEYICQELAKTNRLHCVDLVEVNPTLADGGGVDRTAEVAISLLQHAVGRKMDNELFMRPHPYSPEGARNLR